MKRFLVSLFISLFISSFIAAQSFKFAWLSDLHIGSPKADEYLTSIVEDINNRGDISFVIVSGDVSEKGKNDELESAKQILDKLTVKYHILPGNHDTKWSQSGCTKFVELWGDDKFLLDFNGVKFIGLNNAIPWRGGGGHVAPEDLKWLRNSLSSINKTDEIVLCTHLPLDSETDNWFEVTNLLRDYNIKAVLVGHGHTHKIYDFNGIPALMARSVLADKKNSYGYDIIGNTPDSLAAFEVNGKNTELKSWGGISKQLKYNIPRIDSVQFKNYSADILWQKDLDATVTTSLVAYGGKLYTSTRNGNISCFDMQGKLLWEYNLNAVIMSSPVVADNVVAAGTITGDIVTLEAKTGTIIQTVGTGEPITSHLIAIGYQGDKVLITGTKPDTVIIAGTGSGKLFCYDLHTLDQVWENQDASGLIETTPMYYDNKLYFGSWDSYLYCIDSRSGVMNWKWNGNRNFYYSPAACKPVTDGKNVFVATPDKFVSAIDLLLGKTNWRKDAQAWESIGISSQKDLLYVKGFSDKFYFLSPKNGKVIKEINMKSGIDTTPETLMNYQGNIIISSANGIVNVIDKNYNLKPLFFAGTSRLLDIQQLAENIFAVSDMDGKIFVFRINSGN